MKKYKLKCFYCGDIFDNRKNVYRYNKSPLCKDCIKNDLDIEGWDESSHDWLLNLIQKYGSYEKVEKILVRILCECGAVTAFDKNDTFNRYCWECERDLD